VLLLDYYKCEENREELPFALFSGSWSPLDLDYCESNSPYPQLDVYDGKRFDINNLHLHVKGVLDLETGEIDTGYNFTEEDHLTYSIYSSYGDAGILQQVYYEAS